MIPLFVGIANDIGTSMLFVVSFPLLFSWYA